MYIIETYNLAKKFGDIVAVNGINLKIKEGEIYGLLGPNGAGKTTTLSILSCMLLPTSGEAYVNGYNVVKQPDQVRKSIGIVFQDPALDDQLTGRENMEIHAMLYNVPKKLAKQRIDEALALVELTDRANSLVKTYSGGMRRRLEIARGLIHRPKVLFLDEPTIGLDPQTRTRIWEYISALTKREKITVILTTHYMDEADRLCDRVAIIDFGKIKAEGTPEELKKQLGGDVITVKTKATDKLAKMVSELGFVKSVNKTMDAVKISLENGEEHITDVACAARDHGIPIESLTLHEPTLNDVFLYHTGREIREEGPAMGMTMMRAKMGRPVR
ncbi:MAG: ATP-binding cassette domain-containing protein [Candidatus Jordarchaeaceae archaeon]